MGRRSAPAPAALPVYQRDYSGDRYPRVEQQPPLHSQHYNYQPKDSVVREHYQQQKMQGASAPSERGSKGAAHEPNRGQGQGQEKDREKSEERRQERTR